MAMKLYPGWWLVLMPAIALIVAPFHSADALSSIELETSCRCDDRSDERTQPKLRGCD